MKVSTFLMGATTATALTIGALELSADNDDITLEAIQSSTPIQTQVVDYGNTANNVCVQTTMDTNRIHKELGSEESVRAFAETKCGIKNNTP